MNNTRIDLDSQSNRSSFRTIYKDRSSKSLHEVKRKRLLDRIGQHSSLKKLQTKLEVPEVVKEKPLEEVQQPVVKNPLEKLNFSHHNPEQCLCGSCDCGRHLCKFKIVRPDIHKRTSYEQHFPLKIPTKSFMLIQSQAKLMNSMHIDLSTVYKNEFNNSLMDKIIKPKPVDTLKDEGPLQSLTVYRSNFKDFKVPNQYVFAINIKVKHTDKHTRQNFPFRSKSVYSKEFTEKTVKRHRSLKSTDQISLGKMWLGQSTYNLNFQKPKSSLLDPIPKHVEKMNQTLNDKLRFRTNYKTDYVLKSSPLCPSKAELQQKAKFASMKHTFAENAEFKSMSPQFHAISTSKHFYV